LRTARISVIGGCGRRDSTTNRSPSGVALNWQEMSKK
jgi:hypothetical protein